MDVYVATPAQRRVLDELARDGATNAEIGKRLFVSKETVRFHLVKVSAATGARTRTGLALWWIRVGRYAASKEQAA